MALAQFGSSANARPTTLLIVGDDNVDRRTLVAGMKRAGFRTVTARHGPDALEALGSDPDLILLDMASPTLNRLGLCHEIRAQTDTPLIVVASSNSELYATLSLEIGADDYVTKPCEIRELLVRVRNALRRKGRADLPAGATARPPQTQMDLRTQTATFGGCTVELTREEFAVLRILIENATHVVPRTAFSQRTASRSGSRKIHGDTTALYTHIRRIRNKLAATGPACGRITTVRGVGYRYDP